MIGNGEILLRLEIAALLDRVVVVGIERERKKLDLRTVIHWLLSWYCSTLSGLTPPRGHDEAVFELLRSASAITGVISGVWKNQ